MKRDKELIRRILMAVEDKEDGEIGPLNHELLADDKPADITYNALLLGTGGFLTYQLLVDSDGEEIWVGHLTSQGYQLLDKIRDASAWNTLKKTGASFSFQVAVKLWPAMLGGVI